jgi:serine/threonine-protein kinase RsbW
MRPSAHLAIASRASEVSYPGDARYIGAVRADLRVLLARCPMADDVILCASELAANAAVHSDSRLPGGRFTVRAQISPCQFARIEVEDSGGLWLPEAIEMTGHHGLDIVRALATDWGVDGDDSVRVAWAWFDWPDRPS